MVDGPQDSTQRDPPGPDSPQVPFEGQPHRTSVLSGPVPRLPPNDLALVLSVYCRAAAALEIPQDEIRRDYLAGAWIEAVAGFRSDGYAEADAERRADALITEILEAMGNGAEWLRERIRLCEQAARASASQSTRTRQI